MQYPLLSPSSSVKYGSPLYAFLLCRVQIGPKVPHVISVTLSPGTRGPPWSGPRQRLCERMKYAVFPGDMVPQSPNSHRWGPPLVAYP